MSLVIRNEQIETFDEIFREDFAARLAAELRAGYAEDVAHLTDDELFDGVYEGVERAEAYGLETDDDVAAFVKLQFTVGWYFDRYPLFRDIFAGDEIAPEHKMASVFETAADDDWEAAAEYSDKELDAEEN